MRTVIKFTVYNDKGGVFSETSHVNDHLTKGEAIDFREFFVRNALGVVSAYAEVASKAKSAKK